MMSKWADYCISAVRYNSTGNHIEKVQVCEDYGKTLGNFEEWLRSNVISSLANNKTFVTLLMNEGGSYSRGVDVHEVDVNGTKYIRTDKDQTTQDNLGNLPTF
jgi:hypothetical protein